MSDDNEEIKVKICTKCKIEKETSEFHKRSSEKDGLNNYCKVCTSKYTKKYYQENKKQAKDYIENKEYLKEYAKNYYTENEEHIKEYSKNYRIKNKEHLKEQAKNYYIENKEHIKEYKKNYYIENEEHIKKYKKNYYIENKEHIKEYKKNYYIENEEHIKEYSKNYCIENSDEINEKSRKKREDNPEIYKKYCEDYKKNNPHIITWRKILRNALYRMGSVKTGHTIDMLGYSADDLKIHMESLFTEGMSWYNHGEWHVDHKIPLSKFKNDTPMHIVNSLENLQPLWAKDNLSKLAKILDEYKNMDIYINYCKI